MLACVKSKERERKEREREKKSCLECPGATDFFLSFFFFFLFFVPPFLIWREKRKQGRAYSLLFFSRSFFWHSVFSFVFLPPFSEGKRESNCCVRSVLRKDFLYFLSLSSYFLSLRKRPFLLHSSSSSSHSHFPESISFSPPSSFLGTLFRQKHLLPCMAMPVELAKTKQAPAHSSGVLALSSLSKF